MHSRSTAVLSCVLLVAVGALPGGSFDNSNVDFLRIPGHNCESANSTGGLRNFEGTVAECEAKCVELGPAGCSGFVRVNHDGALGGGNTGQCFFRVGMPGAPHVNTWGDKRDCFIPTWGELNVSALTGGGTRQAGTAAAGAGRAASDPSSAGAGATVNATHPFKLYKGMNCDGSTADVLREFTGTPEECKAKCLSLGEECAGFIRLNGGVAEHLVGTCFFRSGYLSPPYYKKIIISKGFVGDDRDCFVKKVARPPPPPAYTGDWVMKPPCNIRMDAPVSNWNEHVGLAAADRRDKDFVCRPASRNKSPRRNKIEEKAILPWIGNTAVLCYSEAEALSEKEALFSGAANATQLCTGTHTCPYLEWYLRAGTGNRYLFVAAAAVYAAETGAMMFAPTPLGSAGGPLPTLYSGGESPPVYYDDPTCDRWGACNVPGSRDNDVDGFSGIYGQGARTTKGMARLRPRMCDLMSAPMLVAKGDTPHPNDIVLHIRIVHPTGAFAEDGGLGAPSLAFFKAAVKDARENHGGDRLVVICQLTSHPWLDTLRAEVGDFIRPDFTPFADLGLQVGARTPGIAERDLQYLSHARLVVLSISTFGAMAGYLSEGAEAIYFPLARAQQQFGPWCELIWAFANITATRFVSGAGVLFQDAETAHTNCVPRLVDRRHHYL